MEFRPLIKDPGVFDLAMQSLPVPGHLTPQQIATAYNIPFNNGAGVKIGIISLGGGWKQTDLNKSMADLGLPPPTINQVLLNGATNNFNINDRNHSLENTLDIFCISAMVPSANITIYITSVNTTADGQAWIDAFNRAIDDGMDIISHSWGTSEEYGDFLAPVLSKAKSNNVIVLSASGDYGSQDTSGNKGVVYPASNADIIAVGGTTLTLNPNGSRSTELGNSDSGGGISNIVPLPAWQTGLTYRIYNSQTRVTGPETLLPRRGIPDVSAPYQYYAFYFDGNIRSGVVGTSASTPIIAGIIARFISLNGRKPDWILPQFYQNQGTSFTNISVGNNASHITEGYAVTPNWDPVTGLGAPIGQTLFDKLTSPPLGKVKNNTGAWTAIKGVWTKQSTGWTQVKDIWIKTTTGWQRPR